MTKTELNKLTKEELVDKALEFQKGQDEAQAELKALEGTIESLNQDLNGANEDVKASEETIKDMEGTIESLKQDLNGANEDVKALEETIKDMEGTIESLNQDRNDASLGKKIVEHGKQRYVVLVPVFKLAGKKCTYKDLREDQSLLKELLKIEGQQIVKLEKK